MSKEQHTAPDENSCQNASHEPPWVISQLTSFHEGHNHALSAMTEPVAPPGNTGRIITREDLTDDIIQNVRNWSAAPTMSGKVLQQTVVTHHFGGDFTAVFDQSALALLNNTKADVRARIAFTKGDSKEFIAALCEVKANGGYASYDLQEDCTFRRAFWATQEQVERAMEFGLDVIQQVCCCYCTGDASMAAALNSCSIMTYLVSRRYTLSLLPPHGLNILTMYCM